MKLNQLFEMQGIFSSQLLKLVALGEPIFVNAKGRTFLSGNERMGYEALRSNHKGWVIQYDKIETPPSPPVDVVRRALDADALNTSSYKENAMAGKGPHSASLFQFERPIETHYNIKKIDGVWTVVDREVVGESKKEDHEHEEFLLRQLAKKMVAAGLEAAVQPAASAVKGPYIRTAYAGFSIHTYHDTDLNDGTKWFSVWFRNGSRTGAITRFKTADEVIKDIL